VGVLHSSEDLESVFEVGEFVGHPAVGDPIHAKVLYENLGDSGKHLLAGHLSGVVLLGREQEGAEAVNAPDLGLGVRAEGLEVVCGYALLHEELVQVRLGQLRIREGGDRFSKVDHNVFGRSQVSSQGFLLFFVFAQSVLLSALDFLFLVCLGIVRFEDGNFNV